MRSAAFALVTLLLFADSALAQYTTPASLRLNHPTFSSQYLTADPTELQGHDAYTIEAWVYPTSYANYPTIVGNDYTQSFWLGLNLSGGIRFYPRGGTYEDIATTVPLDTWSHVAATYDAVGGWAIYVNGIAIDAAATITGAVGLNPNDLFIGADREFGAPSYFWRGYLDEVRIWSEARTLTEIQENMFIDVGRPAFQSPAYAEIQAVWDMQAPAVSVVFDRASGFGKLQQNASFQNGATTDPFVPPVSPNTAVEFDGTNGYAVMPMTDGFGDGITVEAWVAPRSYLTFPTIAGRDFVTGWWFGFSQSGKLRFYHNGASSFLGGVSNFVDGNATVPLDQWSHVAVTYRNGFLVFYINGEVDKTSTQLTGPVGENGLDVFVGADNNGGTPDFPFNGYMDEVRVTRGVKTAVQLRDQMFGGFTTFVNPITIPTELGPADMHRVDFDGFQFNEIFGTNSRLVKSGAPMGAVGWATSSEFVGRYHYSVDGGLHLPDGDVASMIVSQIDVPEDVMISDVDVFVSAPTTALYDVIIDLESPSATNVALTNIFSATGGRDIHTVFDDSSPNTFGTSFPPFIHGVQPAEPLSNFNGESTLGTWELTLTAGGGFTHLDLWAWGIQFNNLTVDAADTPLPTRADLQLAGAHPVRGTGGFTLEVGSASSVDLSLVDVMGRHARTLYSGSHPQGTSRIQWSTRSLSPGVYFAVLRIDGQVEKRLRVVVVE